LTDVLENDVSGEWISEAYNMFNVPSRFEILHDEVLRVPQGSPVAYWQVAMAQAVIGNARGKIHKVITMGGNELVVNYRGATFECDKEIYLMFITDLPGSRISVSNTVRYRDLR